MAVPLRRVVCDIEGAIAVARERKMPELEAFAFNSREAMHPYDSKFW